MGILEEMEEHVLAVRPEVKIDKTHLEYELFKFLCLRIEYLEYRIEQLEKGD